MSTVFITMDLTDIGSSPGWMRDALCTDCDPELFFPSPQDEIPPRHGEAIRICRRCPVRRECLEWAITTGDKHAILGGQTPNQRTRTRNRILRKRGMRANWRDSHAKP
jgi:WhiB family transcriptional regulator, redox-sensing transcriptional regulator